MSREIPSQRWEALATIAAASRTRRVLVVCRSRAIRRQYERAIPRLGGNLDNVIFRVGPGVVAPGSDLEQTGASGEPKGGGHE